MRAVDSESQCRRLNVFHSDEGRMGPLVGAGSPAGGRGHMLVSIVTLTQKFLMGYFLPLVVIGVPSVK